VAAMKGNPERGQELLQEALSLQVAEGYHWGQGQARLPRHHRRAIRGPGREGDRALARRRRIPPPLSRLLVTADGLGLPGEHVGARRLRPRIPNCRRGVGDPNSDRWRLSTRVP
jgi:hypothetical protein